MKSEKVKRYTAQEMREMAKYMSDSVRDVLVWPKDSYTPNDLEVMLRQAADAEEENAQLKASKERWMQFQETAAGERNACIDELRKKDAEIAQLKAQVKYEPRPKRNCDRFEDWHTAYHEYSAKNGYPQNGEPADYNEQLCTFLTWLFALLAESRETGK